MITSWYETLSALLAFVIRGMHRTLLNSPHKGPLMWTFDIFLVACLKELLNKKLNLWGSGTPWLPCDVTVMQWNNPEDYGYTNLLKTHDISKKDKAKVHPVPSQQMPYPHLNVYADCRLPGLRTTRNSWTCSALGVTDGRSYGPSAARCSLPGGWRRWVKRRYVVLLLGIQSISILYPDGVFQGWAMGCLSRGLGGKISYYNETPLYQLH